MDLATLIGLATSLGLVVASMARGGGAGAFVDVPSVLIVVGGTLGVTLINYPLATVLSTFKVVRAAFFFKLPAPEEVVSTLVTLAGKARKEGVLALERDAAGIADPYFTQGLRLAADGEEPAVIETLLTKELDALRQRHRRGAELIGAMASYAPALGLVGTLIGVVQVLQAPGDPASAGPTMALALLAMLYGTLVANVVCLPVAGKLRVRSDEEVLHKELLRDGILAIAAGLSPRAVEIRLAARLAPHPRPAPE
jgi:chemotaxis protein MotA